MVEIIKPETNQLNLRYCAENKPAELDFVAPGFLSGTVGCIAAAGSTGKSFYALEMAAGVCSGDADRSLLNLGIKHHGRTVILNAEDPATILHQRFHDLCSYLSSEAREVLYEQLSIEVLMGVRPRTDIMSDEWLDTVCKAADGARLVIFDTLTRWHSVQENDNAAMSQVISRFEAICRQTGAAVLFLHHVSKGMAVEGRQDEQQATRGAAAITDNCRWQGWMQTMSKQEAEAFGVDADNRKRYVKTGGNKENYGQASGEKWLERQRGGVLIPVELEVKSEKTGTKAKAKRGRSNDI